MNDLLFNVILQDNKTQTITEIISKIMGVALPIAISILVCGAIFSLIKAAAEGMFSSDSDMRKETKRKYLFIFVSLAIGILSSSLIYAFKDAILTINT